MPKVYPPDVWLSPDIRLPDGRRIAISDIRNQVSDYRLLNIRAILNVKPKYSQEDREWIATAGVERVMERYRCSRTMATSLIYTSKGIVYNQRRRKNYNQT